MHDIPIFDRKSFQFHIILWKCSNQNEKITNHEQSKMLIAFVGEKKKPFSISIWVTITIIIIITRKKNERKTTNQNWEYIFLLLIYAFHILWYFYLIKPLDFYFVFLGAPGIISII